MTTTPPTGTGDTALDTLGERVCAAAGTDLATVITDLHARADDAATPAAIRAGWNLPDTDLPTLDTLPDMEEA